MWFLSRYCHGCQLAPDSSDEGYGNWAINHKCQKNTECNVGCMEKIGLRYTPFRRRQPTYHALTQDLVYGYLNIEPSEPCSQEDAGGCLHLVGQEEGTRPVSRRERRAHPGEDKKIITYYGYALRSHRHDIPAMQKAVTSTLSHMTSTDGVPDLKVAIRGVHTTVHWPTTKSHTLAKNPLPASVRTPLRACTL